MIDELESEGDLLHDYSSYLEDGFCLALMPVARLIAEWGAYIFPEGVTFYSPGWVQTANLNVVPNKKDSRFISERCSALSGIDEAILCEHSLAVFPYRLDWDKFRGSDHRDHLELIQTLSEHVDRNCFDYIRYRQCPLLINGDATHNLPGRAGQVDTNHMMAGALLYNHTLREARIIGGDAFTHIITRGIGLPLEDLDHSTFPRKGEVGFIVSHALTLYTLMLEANNPTSFFVQALSLLEFLAYPDEYRSFENVKKVIARYIAKNQSEYQQLLERFFELTGKKEEATGRIIGYRTRIVHIGERIESVVPDPTERRKLFFELDGYVRSVMDHMVKHSAMNFEEYLNERDTMRPYDA